MQKSSRPEVGGGRATRGRSRACAGERADSQGPTSCACTWPGCDWPESGWPAPGALISPRSIGAGGCSRAAPVSTGDIAYSCNSNNNYDDWDVLFVSHTSKQRNKAQQSERPGLRRVPINFARLLVGGSSGLFQVGSSWRAWRAALSLSYRPYMRGLYRPAAPAAAYNVPAAAACALASHQPTSGAGDARGSAPGASPTRRSLFVEATIEQTCAA